MGNLPAFLNDWSDFDQAQLESVFELPAGSLNTYTLLLVNYSATIESGYAFVLFMDKDRQLYEVNASHDSEFNLKGQWLPEESSVDALQFRLDRGRLGLDANDSNLFADELRQCLKQLAH